MFSGKSHIWKNFNVIQIVFLSKSIDESNLDFEFETDRSLYLDLFENFYNKLSWENYLMF